MNPREEILANLDVSRETSDRLDSYAELLAKWNKAINLVAPTSLGELWSRHFLDSAQLMRLAPKSGHWVDIGTGGGFPGLVCAILAKESAPALQFTLIESDQRKCAFLSTVLRATGVQTKILSQRIEAAAPQAADILSARALAPLDKLLAFADRHLGQSGIALFLKGARHEEELAKALETWAFDVTSHQSETDPNGAILTIGNLTRV